MSWIIYYLISTNFTEKIVELNFYGCSEKLLKIIGVSTLSPVNQAH